MHTSNAINITLRQMDAWYQTPLGSYLLELERTELDKYLPYYYGDHLLQVGGPSETFLFEGSAIAHRIRLSPEPSPIFHGPSVCGGLYELPFLSDSIDLLLLPHMLELIQHPDDFLAECYRVLAPEGRVVILSFNPWSLWGLRRYLGKRKALPWRIHFRPKIAVSRVLLAQQFIIERTSTVLFQPALKNPTWLKKLFPLEALGRICWSDWGAVYMIVAHKREFSPIMLEMSSLPSI